jgi:hypothetical protein
MDFIDKRFERLALIADELFPKVVPSNGEHSEWLVTGPAFVARATRSLFAMRFLRQARFDADAFTLLRSLYEHLARFAWIAVDPPAHIEVWLKWDRKERIKADNEAKQVDERFFSADVRAHVEAERDAVEADPMDLYSQAKAADAHWAQVIGVSGPRERYGFAGLYRTVYRWGSAVAHGTAFGLDTVITGSTPGTRTIGLERDAAHNPYSLAQVVYALGLLVYAQAFEIHGVAEALDDMAVEIPDPRVEEVPT